MQYETVLENSILFIYFTFFHTYIIHSTGKQLMVSKCFIRTVHFRISLCVSIYLMIGVGIERYIAVCRPHHFRQVQTDNYRYLIKAFLWKLCKFQLCTLMLINLTLDGGGYIVPPPSILCSGALNIDLRGPIFWYNSYFIVTM